MSLRGLHEGSGFLGRKLTGVRPNTQLVGRGRPGIGPLAPWTKSFACGYPVPSHSSLDEGQDIQCMCAACVP